MSTPHAAIAPTLAFLRDYYAQIDRLLSDVSRHLLESDRPWQRLRRLGDTYETQAEVKVGQPELFAPRYLGHWYAPASAFGGGSNYGADTSKCAQIAFVGVWLGDETNAPELYAGWIEGMNWVPGKVVETHLKNFNGWLDPYECEPPHDLTALSNAVFEPRSLRWADGGILLAMGRVSLAEIDGPKALHAFVQRWLAALPSPTHSA